MIKKRLFVMGMAIALLGLSACTGGGNATTEQSSETKAETTAETTTEAESSTEESKKEEVEGTPISLPATMDYTMGTMPVHSEWIQFPEPYVIEDIFSPQIVAVGDYIFVLTDDTNLGKYKREGDKLTLEDSWTLDEDYEMLSKGPDNTFYLTAFMRPMLQMDVDGNVIAQYEDGDHIKMNPSGSSGIRVWYGSTPEKVTLSATNVTREPISALEGYKVGDAGASNSHMFLFGSAPDSDRHKVFVLDDGDNVIYTLGNDESLQDDSLGSVQSMIETDNYYVALDGNMRNLVFWDKEGNFAGAIDDADIFGTGYPWICTSTVADDGTIYIGLTDGREEKDSKSEFLLFTVSGF